MLGDEHEPGYQSHTQESLQTRLLPVNTATATINTNGIGWRPPGGIIVLPVTWTSDTTRSIQRSYLGRAPSVTLGR